MRQFYQVTDKIKNTLLADVNCNNVTIGQLNEADLAKQNIFPLAHIIVGDASLNGSTISMDFTIICMDIVDFNKETLRSQDDTFHGTNDLQDIYNTQLAVVNRLVEVLRRGDETQNYELVGTFNATPFQDRFENMLAGWAIDLTIVTPNIELCIDG
jgi:hypothetical protein